MRIGRINGVTKNTIMFSTTARSSVGYAVSDGFMISDFRRKNPYLYQMSWKHNNNGAHIIGCVCVVRMVLATLPVNMLIGR